MRKLTNILIGLFVSLNLYGQTVTERLTLTNTKKSIYLKSNNIAFDKQENYCFKMNKNIETTIPQNRLILVNDSGIVTKKEGLPFLLSNSLTDTIPHSNSWHLFNENDTIGKYYRIENSNNYMVCLIDYGCAEESLFETHLIIEINGKGELVKSARFRHWNYSYCWNDFTSGFHKYGDFFGIEICGTGLGFCSSNLHLFKEVTPQDSIFGIPLGLWFNYDKNNTTRLSVSNMEINKDEFILHYVLVYGKLKYNKKSDSYYTKMKKREIFQIRYFYENGKWNTKDTANYERIKPL